MSCEIQKLFISTCDQYNINKVQHIKMCVAHVMDHELILYKGEMSVLSKFPENILSSFNNC